MDPDSHGVATNHYYKNIINCDYQNNIKSEIILKRTQERKRYFWRKILISTSLWEAILVVQQSSSYKRNDWGKTTLKWEAWPSSWRTKPFPRAKDGDKQKVSSHSVTLSVPGESTQSWLCRFSLKLCSLVFQCGLKRLHEWGNVYRKKVKSMWVCKMPKKMYSEGWATAHRKMFIDFLFFMVVFSKNKKALSQGWECSSVGSVCVACMKPWSLSSTKQARGYMIKIPALRR